MHELGAAGAVEAAVAVETRDVVAVWAVSSEVSEVILLIQYYGEQINVGRGEKNAVQAPAATE